MRRKADLRRGKQSASLPSDLYCFGEAVGEIAGSACVAGVPNFMSPPVASTLVALMTYVMVTLPPTIRSPVTLVCGSRSISHRSALLNDDLRGSGLQHSSGDFIRLRASGKGRAAKNKIRSRNQTNCHLHFHGENNARPAYRCKLFTVATALCAVSSDLTIQRLCSFRRRFGHRFDTDAGQILISLQQIIAGALGNLEEIVHRGNLL